MCLKAFHVMCERACQSMIVGDWVRRNSLRMKRTPVNVNANPLTIYVCVFNVVEYLGTAWVSRPNILTIVYECVLLHVSKSSGPQAPDATTFLDVLCHIKMHNVLCSSNCLFGASSLSLVVLKYDFMYHTPSTMSS